MADNYVPTEFQIHMNSFTVESGDIDGLDDSVADPVGAFLAKARGDFAMTADPGWDEEIGTGVVQKAPERDFMSTQESYELHRRITRCVDKTIDGISWRYFYDSDGELLKIE